MSEAEKALVMLLAGVWNAFLKLPVEHPDDVGEFRHGVHFLQEKILARAGRREINGAAK